MKQTFGRFICVLAMGAILSCEIIDNDIERHTSDAGSMLVGLDEVARILASLPLEAEHLSEVHRAAVTSSENGYDEEYTMRNLFAQPGRGVGEGVAKSGSLQMIYDNPLKNLIETYVRSSVQTKSAEMPAYDADEFLAALSGSDIQIYWPFSGNWDGKTMPVITFDPEDGADVNIGYRLVSEEDDDVSCRVEEVIVDEEMAAARPVWVVNRNSDAEFTTLEMLRREDPDWGAGGGDIIVKPVAKTVSGSESLRSLVLKDFTMKRNYDSWFAGASEFFVKTGFIDDFTASTEAELRLYNPLVTDFMIVVRRSQLGKSLPFNALLVSDWNPQMTHCAFMITEDDGGTKTEWECTALVRIASKSYGVELNLPFNSRDDIVWRGHLTNRWIEANNNLTGHFGDVELTFELVEY